MKKILFAVILVVGLMVQRADAQSRVSVHLNVGSQPHYAYGYHHRYYTRYRPVYHYVPTYRTERVYYRPYSRYHRVYRRYRY